MLTPSMPLARLPKVDARALRAAATRWTRGKRVSACALYSATAGPSSTDQGESQPSAELTQQQQSPRFYAQQLPASVGCSVELAPEEARHAVRVLRLRPGDPLELCDGAGTLVRCEVTHTDKSSAVVAATHAPRLQPWQGPQWAVAVGCLTLKGGRTDWLIEKCTELGAHSVLPLITERSQAADKNKFRTAGGGGGKRGAGASAAAGNDFQPGRLERLAIAATKQSLRVHALQLAPPTLLADLLSSMHESPLALVATAGAPPAGLWLQQALGSSPHSTGKWQQMCSRPCYLFIGPEGDFTPEEVAALAAAGALPVGLGSNRLRTETAAVALLAAAAAYAEAAAAAPASSGGSLS